MPAALDLDRVARVTRTTAITDFLEWLAAQLAEDEELVEGLPPRRPTYADTHSGLELTHDGLMADPVRVMRDCEAKRLIVELHAPTMAGQTVGRVILGQLIEPVWVCPSCSVDGGNGYTGIVEAPCPTLRAIAAVYADHPGYREEWRP